VSGPRASLLQTLSRAHLRLALTAVVTAGLLLTVLSFVTLRGHVEQNLRLLARSVAYSAEAAVVFDDALAAQEALHAIAVPEGLRSAELLRADGSSLARYDRQPTSRADEALMDAGGWLFALGARVPIDHQGRPVGAVLVQGNGNVYLQFLGKVLAAVAFCSALIGWRVARQSRQIERDIVQPLHALASLTRTARTSRAFQMRAPDASVAEIHTLGEDFNALIAEIQDREAALVAKHDKLRTANVSLSFLAFHDSLTGLPNRARFVDRVEQALRTHGQGNDKVAVLYVDCDEFKSVNDRFGHAAGDALLVEVALRIRSQLREDGLVARLGGDEFAVLLAPIASIEFTLRIAQRIAAAVREPFAHPAFGALPAQASIGVAVFPDHAANASQLIVAADAAMYRAKAHQDGRVVLAATASGESVDTTRAEVSPE
jgi:diguanylate cyclase (GGDEF)-like protein